MLVLSFQPFGFSASAASEPNPPVWPSSVKVFSPGDADISMKLSSAYKENGGHSPTNHGQFSSSRFAFLFKPGSYDVDAPVGYYTQVLGLGATPSEVTFTSAKGVYSEEQDFTLGGALSTFWRSAENFRSKASFAWGTGKGMMWAVSQAAPLRRVEVDNDLVLFEYQPPATGAGEASGGFMANMKVGAAVRSHARSLGESSRQLGSVAPGSQQQWFSRNSMVADWGGGVWNMVFSGVEGAPASHCGPPTATVAGSGPFTTVSESPTIAEKPYITIDSQGKYTLQVPNVKLNSNGYDPSTVHRAIPFESVYVTKPGDSADTINAKLASKYHIVFSPAIYHLDKELKVTEKGTVLLGLGLATLVSSKQNKLIVVGDVDGVRVAGLLLQAGPLSSSGAAAPVLLEWGTTGTFKGNANMPGVMHDLFARVGGPDGTAGHAVGVTTMVHIRSGHVIGDNMWLWRADHAEGGAVTYTSNACQNGLIVDGDDVTMYGLAVEHTLKDLTLWNGERGKTFFYQSELPYLVTQQQYGDKGYVGYRVAEDVKAHNAWGVGVYSYFRDHDVTVHSGIACPKALESSFVHPLTVFLNGHGGIEHVINDKGKASFGPSTSVNYVC